MAADGYDGGNTTGFVSPAAYALEGPIDLAGVLDLRRPSRYVVRVSGDALRGRGILCGDILIADAAASLKSGKVCVAFVHGATLAFRDGGWWLLPSADWQEPVALRGDDTDAYVWGIVCGLVRTDV